MAKLFVALDGLLENEKETSQIATSLVNEVGGEYGFKLNLDYIICRGVGSAVSKIIRWNRPIFVDLKMWNGKRTMATTVQQLVDIEVDYVSIYALADGQLLDAVKITKGTRTQILAATVLTHYDDDYCKKHFRRSLKDAVRHFTEVGRDAGCHGVILPGTCLDSVRDIPITKVVPGVRPKWYKDDRHKEEVEPRYACEHGAEILVCGSPILRTINPTQALRDVLAEMKS